MRSQQVGADPDLGTGYREHYIRDAQGDIMAIYRYTNPSSASLRLTENPIYGSSRLGSYQQSKQLRGVATYIMGMSLPSIDNTQPLYVSRKRYELNDHLGNVTAVVTGRLLNGNGPSPWQPELLSAAGYEPFGSLLPGRNYSSDSYRFGFNGQEKDDEVFGSTGTSMSAEFWQYDTRTGRRWNLDPVDKPWQSRYSTFSGNPIARVDPRATMISSIQLGD